MNLTNKLKQWVIANCDVKSTATDEEFRSAAGKAIADGDLSTDKFKELSTTKEDEEAGQGVTLLKGLTDTMHELKEMIKPTEKKVDDKTTDDEKKAAEEAAQKKADEEAATKKRELEKKEHKPSQLEKMVTSMSMPITDVDGDEKTFGIRVKQAAESYEDTKSTLTYPDRTGSGKAHPSAGQPVRDFDGGRVMETGSELDKAVIGAFSKFLVNTAKLKSRTLSFMQMPQHDKELLCYAMENMKWGGSSDAGDYADIKDRKLTPVEQKQLIDDATSGGLEAAPIVFDDDVIQTPLLHGELFPLVKIVPLDRGRRIEGVITGTVTGTWGGVDDTSITLFNTAGYVTAFDTTIFRWEGAIRIGLDFLSDTPIDFGQHITSQYGERLLEDLDDVIATGNGTTQPEGVMNKTGVTTIAWGAATTLGNYESTRFGVAKPEHKSNLVASAVFCGTETSYQRARAIPVGAADARRLGGMDYSSYRWMERPFKINESLTNAQVFYAILARYRMYRRRGLTMRTSTEGDTLIRRNEMLMVAMARYGGQLERGAVAAVTTTAPA